MLSTLRIRHIGVIDEATLEFGPGFTALTGETGAGKTMVVTGLGLLLGSRLDTRRAGAASTVDGTLALAGHDALAAALEDLGAESEDGEVLVVRRVTKDGRSRAQIGGVPVPIGALARHVGSAVTVHGQSDQQRLRDADHQRAALDEHAGEDVLTARAEHQRLWRDLAASERELEELQQLAVERDRRGAVLTSALERIDGLDPQVGEDEQLREEIARLGNAADLRGAVERASLALLGEDDGPAAGALVDLAGDAVRAASRTDERLAPLADRLASAREEISDIAADLARYAEDIDAPPARIDEANERLRDLNALVRDLGPELGGAEDIHTLLEASRAAAADIDRYAGIEERLTDCSARQETLRGQVEVVAADLTERRRSAAAVLAAAIQEELRHLEMPDADIQVEVLEGPHRADGRDQVRILLAPHPGADHLPVATAASGGELSRVMLALEVALASPRRDHLAAPVFVFDEIDAGIGGRAALAVGQRLARLARHAQVIVVTHLPQVAAHASTHLQIVKRTAEGQDAPATSSTVEILDAEGRIRELARMLAGDDASDIARRHAEELLADASRTTGEEVTL